MVAPGSHANMDFSRDLSGKFKSNKTSLAFSYFSKAPVQDQANDNFILSMMVAYATDSSLLGYVAGGSLIGGLVGAGMSHGHQREVNADTHRQNNVL